MSDTQKPDDHVTRAVPETATPAMAAPEVTAQGEALSDGELDTVSGGGGAMGSAFEGLPLGNLIGGPLNGAADAQSRLANNVADFIKQFGSKP